MDAPKHERLWTKFLMTDKIKQVEVFRKELSEVKSTLMLGLMYQKWARVLHRYPAAADHRCSIQKPSLCFTNDEVRSVNICGSAISDVKGQLQNPAISKRYDPSPSYTGSAPDSREKTQPLSCIQEGTSGNTSLSAIASSAVVQKFLQHSMYLAVDDLFASGTVQQLMEASLNKVTSFDTVHAGSYDGDEHDIRRVPMTEYEESQSNTSNSTTTSDGQSAAQEAPPRLSRSRTCYGTSSIGIVLGSIWIRTSTLKVAAASSISAGQLEVITSFIFYPASWLSRVGLRYGAEANLQWSPNSGWKFNLATVRAVPENSHIFDFCREGNLKAVMRLIERGDASLEDTSPKGWTPLHVSALLPQTREQKADLHRYLLVCSCFRPHRTLRRADQ